MDPKDLLLFHLRESGFYAFYHNMPMHHLIQYIHGHRHEIYAPAGIWVFRSRWSYWSFVCKSILDYHKGHRFAVISRYVDAERPSSETEIKIELFPEMAAWQRGSTYRNLVDLTDPSSLDELNRLLRLHL